MQVVMQVVMRLIMQSLMRCFALFAAVYFCAPLPAQVPHVGEINFYGLRKVTPEKILGAVKIKPGDLLPASKGGMEDQIEEIPNVVLASVQAMCCDGADVTLFIGIEEKGSPHAAFRSEPAGDVTLPQELTDTFRQFLSTVQRAAARGNTTEDLTAGHSIMDDPEARVFQSQFVTFATDNLDILRNVLRNAADAEQRATAAAVIGYAATKQDVVNDLEYALDDPDEAVRANAIRSLKAFGVLASKQPQLGLKISPTWFVQLLNSVTLSDRVESAKALVILTDHSANGPGHSAIGQLRESALPALAEMARWKTLRYALPPFLLLGRVAGMQDEQIQQSWEKGQREPVIEKALAGDAPKRMLKK
jgi:hypothetical protein